MSDVGSCPGREVIEVLAAGGTLDADVRRHVDACPSCSAVLEEIKADNELLGALLEANTGRLDGDRPVAVGGVPDGYEIIDELHRGSQGVVFRARQSATKRVVALKVTLGGALATDASRARFERESEVIAQLRHPNIVTVFDAGVTPDGRQYLVMELIDGEPLPSPAAHGAIVSREDLRRSLEQFRQICDAVVAAHRRGIIHRDLKPANILVDKRGVPRVLDFGLAKLLDPEEAPSAVLETREGQFLGTFAYAAPEQVSGDPHSIDTRCDLYALGVILYELLAGRRPYELRGSVRHVVEAITTQPPDPLWQGRPWVDRDLETIVLRAVEKNPDRRYQTVDEMAEDVRRWLAGEPIMARRDDAWYVMRKNIVRYRVPLGIACMFFVIVVGFSIATYLSQRRAERESARRGTAVTLIADAIAKVDREDPEGTMPARNIISLLDEISGIIDETLVGSPDEVQVRNSIGLAYLSHNQFDAAERHLQAALDRVRTQHDDVDHAVAQALHNMGRLYWNIGRFDRAEVFYREALGQYEVLVPGDDANKARTMQHLASSLRESGKLNDSHRLFTDSLEMRRRILNPVSPPIANNVHGLGNCLRDMGRYEEAGDCYREAIRLIEQLLGPGNWRVGRSMNNLATCLIDMGAFEEAESLLAEAWRIKGTVGAQDGLDLANHEHSMGRLAFARGDHEAAAAHLAIALDERRRGYTEAHPQQAGTLVVLARTMLALGRIDEAGACIDEALEILRNTVGESHWATAEARIVRARWLRAAGRPAEAAEETAAAVPVLESVLAPTASVWREVD